MKPTQRSWSFSFSICFDKLTVLLSSQISNALFGMNKDQTFICQHIPSFGVSVISWSRNCPNCITMCVYRGSGISESGWFFCEIHRGLGNDEGCRPPRGTLLPSWYAGDKSRLSVDPAEPHSGFYDKNKCIGMCNLLIFPTILSTKF